MVGVPIGVMIKSVVFFGMINAVSASSVLPQHDQGQQQDAGRNMGAFYSADDGVAQRERGIFEDAGVTEEQVRNYSQCYSLE